MKTISNLSSFNMDVWVGNKVNVHHLDPKYLIIDATRIKIWKDEETDLIKFGYCSRNEIKSLPQENLILGVNNQYVPLFANISTGNTADVKIFSDFLSHTIAVKFEDNRRAIL